LSVQAFTHGDAQDLLAEFKRASERRDPDLMLELFAEEAEYRPHPFEPPLVGANAIRAHWNEAFASEQHVEFDAERIWLAGTTVLSSWHAALTLIASGERLRVRGFMTLELDDNRRIVRMREWAIPRSVGVDSTVRSQQQEVAGGG
jgi:ketosteroid isomerase-like protein